MAVALVPREDNAFANDNPPPARNAVLARYRQLREISKKHHHDILKLISGDAMLQQARRLGLVQGRTLILDDMEEMSYVFDLAIYTAPPGRSRAIDRYARSAQLPPGSDEALMLEAMRAARFAILIIGPRHDAMLDPGDGLPEAIGQMFIGMALFRLGFFTLGWTTRAYGLLIAAGYLVAAPITAWLAWKIVQADFDPLALHRLEVWGSGARPFIALAHAGVVLLIVRAGTAPDLIERLAAAGRMAFSNYLMTSIITTFVFCGFGLGLYGKLSRFEQLAVVAGVWVFILIWSKPWLERFHYGPFEWAWRSLVKWSPQPFVRGGIKPAVVA